MADMLPVWGIGSGLTPRWPEDEDATREYVRKCVDHGVTRLIPGREAPLLVQIGHEHGLEVDAYRWVNSYGGNQPSIEWSVQYPWPRLGAPGTRELLDGHRPVFGITEHQLTIDEFAERNPQFWCKNREGRSEPLPGETLSLSFGFPEVRRHEAGMLMDVHRKSKSDGLQMEFVLLNMDDDGVNTFGYEEPIAQAFERESGVSPFDRPNGDPEWTKFRAGYVTTFVRELKDTLKAESPEARFTATVIAREPGDYMKVFQDWPAWLDQGLLDELFIWFRTTSDLGEVERQTRRAAEVVNGRMPLVVELSCFHPGSFQRPEALLEAARVARVNGADAVGVYRSHAVEQLDLWSTVDQIRRL